MVAGYPNMSAEAGRKIHELVRQERARYVLELGFNWGVSSCYIAAALKRNGGHLVTIDLASRAAFDPGIENFLSRLGLGDTCTVYFETSTYNWRLREFLRMPESPVFDLIFLDGAHLFEPDGLAFILGERLLRGGGLFLFDDYRWTIQGSPHFQRNPGLVQQYSEQEKSCASRQGGVRTLGAAAPERRRDLAGRSLGICPQAGEITAGPDRDPDREAARRSRRVPGRGKKSAPYGRPSGPRRQGLTTASTRTRVHAPVDPEEGRP